jgi:hypothetical protein
VLCETSEFFASAETMAVPGAVRSGLILPSRVGPRELKGANCPSLCASVKRWGWPSIPVQKIFVVYAPTAMIFLAVAGSVTVAKESPSGK